MDGSSPASTTSTATTRRRSASAPAGRGRRGLRRNLRVDVVLAPLRGHRCGSTRSRSRSDRRTGAAFVGWDGTYSFNVDGRRIPVESLQVTASRRRRCPACCTSTRPAPATSTSLRYDVKARVDDLFAGEEGVSHRPAVAARRAADRRLRSRVPRLSVSGSGRLELTDRLNAEMSMRFQDTSLDPYLRFFEPRLSPFTTAVASGTVRAWRALRYRSSPGEHAGRAAEPEAVRLRARQRRADRPVAEQARARDRPAARRR